MDLTFILSYQYALDVFLVILEYIPYSIKMLLYLALGMALGVGFIRFLMRI